MSNDTKSLSPQKSCVLCLLEDTQTGKMLMIKHLRGINKGFYNFPGGKMEKGESIPHAVAREFREETGLTLHNAKCVGRIDIKPYENTPSSPDDMHIYIFYSNKYSGVLKSAEGEVEAFWHNKDSLPYEQMQKNDLLWLPEVMQGKTVHKIYHRTQDGFLSPQVEDDNAKDTLQKLQALKYLTMSDYNY